MARRCVIVALLGLTGCEPAEDLVVVEAPGMLASHAEPQRLNIDEVGPKVVRRAGVAPVRVTPLADPRFATPRAQVTAFEDEPPPLPLTEAQAWFARLDARTRTTVREICREGRHDPCFGMLAVVRGAAATRLQLLRRQLGDREESDQAFAYCREHLGLGACDTPLVVAFDGEAVQFAPGAAPFAFQPGVPVTTDWPTPATPWIALDRDGDGAITSGAELFGDATVLPDGATAKHGFEALAALDANRDGVLDRRDPAFARLLLWSDRDGDRRSSPGELAPLAATIVSIPLAHELVPRCAGGNCEGERAVMTWRDPSGRAHTGAVIDVYLRRRLRTGD